MKKLSEESIRKLREALYKAEDDSVVEIIKTRDFIDFYLEPSIQKIIETEKTWKRAKGKRQEFKD